MIANRSLTVWISLTAGKLVNWDAPRPRRRKPGRQRKYSNHAIETAVTLGMVFHLSSRQSEGLLRSLFALMKLDNDVPDHTTISRRKAKLGKVPFYQDKQKTPLHILIDSSGLAAHAGQLRRAPNSKTSKLGELGSVDDELGVGDPHWKCLPDARVKVVGQVAEQLDRVLTAAEQEALSALEVLDRLVGEQAARRRERSIERRIVAARFAERKTLDTFDWNFNKTIQRVQYEQLATAEFV